MAHHSLQITAAYYALGMANTEQLIDSADDALNDSVYSYSLGELYSPSNPSWAHCSALFVAALGELQVSLPDPSTAILTLLEFHLTQMVEGVVTESKALDELYSIARELRYYPPV